VNEQEPTEAQLEEKHAKESLRDAEAEAEGTLERAEELSERVEEPPPRPE
jgi:hypothetical protein